jgi:hypothetical protein
MTALACANARFFTELNGLDFPLQSHFSRSLNAPSRTHFRRPEFALIDGNVKQSLRNAYVSDSLSDLHTVLSHFAKALNIRYFSSAQTEPFTISRALASLRDHSQILAFSKISANPRLFIQTMCDGRKLHKRDPLDISSSVGMIAYPKAELADFATRIFF